MKKNGIALLAMMKQNGLALDDEELSTEGMKTHLFGTLSSLAKPCINGRPLMLVKYFSLVGFWTREGEGFCCFLFGILYGARCIHLYTYCYFSRLSFGHVIF